MVGILLVSHGALAQSFLDVAREILGETEGVLAFGLPEPLQEERVIEEIQQARKALDHGEGLLIVTDMFGGTPCNLSLSFLDDDGIEVLTGMNLRKFFLRGKGYPSPNWPVRPWSAGARTSIWRARSSNNEAGTRNGSLPNRFRPEAVS